MNMERLEIEKFTPAIAEIQKVVEEGKGITVSDFTNKAQLKLVKDQRLKLRDIRTAIAKQGKAFRQKATDFSKAVIAKEKDLIALVEPEEERLIALEDRADKEKELAERRELLPKRKERLASIGDDVEISESEILEMDSTVFEGYCNKRFSDKNEKDRLALEEKSRLVKIEEEKLAQEKEMRQREDKARQEERERAEQAEKNRKEREEREAKEKVEREARDKAEVERLAKENKEREEREAKEAVLKLASDKKYQDFLVSCGWSKEKAGEFYIEVKGNNYSIYKKVGEITL